MKKHISVRVLFVEDEPLALELMGRSLTDHGYELTSFSCPQKALNWFVENSNCIDVLVTDQSMPLITGTELAFKMREIKPELPVIIVTGMGVVGVELKDGSPLEVIEKPYKRQDLFNAIDSLAKRG